MPAPVIPAPPDRGRGQAAGIQCECVACCNGEHAGACKECAGWGDIDGDPCAYCNETGDCPICEGRSRPDKEDGD